MVWQGHDYTSNINNSFIFHINLVTNKYNEQQFHNQRSCDPVQTLLYMKPIVKPSRELMNTGMGEQ